MAVLLPAQQGDESHETPHVDVEIVRPWGLVPWRSIIAVGIVGVALWLLIIAVTAALRVIVLIVLGGFIAIVLAPAVRWLDGKTHSRRIAVSCVMFGSVLVVLGAITLFVLPIRTQLVQAVTDLPGSVNAAANGKGPVGDIISRLHLESFVREHEGELQRWANDVDKSSLSIAQSVATGVIGAVTVFVIAFLFLTQSGTIGKGALSVVPMRRRGAVQRIAHEAAHAVSGYMVGNLLISLIAGTTAFICLALLGVPNAAVLALLVAFADLIPLVGATMGAAVAATAAFLHSPTAGIIALIFFIVYQQVENSVLQAAIMARAVKVNPLVVLLSVLVGVELFGFLGALIAIPLAGSVQALLKGIQSERSREHFSVDG